MCSLPKETKKPAHPYLELAKATGCYFLIFPLRRPHITRDGLSMLGEPYLALSSGFYYTLEPMSRGWIGPYLRGCFLSLPAGQAAFLRRSNKRLALV